jgi:hypothetical protein
MCTKKQVDIYAQKDISTPYITFELLMFFNKRASTFDVLDIGLTDGATVLDTTFDSIRRSSILFFELCLKKKSSLHTWCGYDLFQRIHIYIYIYILV